MRMAGPDIVLLVVGAVLFGGATYAIVNLDGGLTGSGSALGIFNVAYTVKDVEGGSESVATLRTATATFEVNATDVVRLQFLVACTGPGGDVGPVTFDLQVAVEGPDGQSAEGGGSCGQGVLVELEIAEPPASTVVRGNTEADARENLAHDANATAAQGTWTVTIAGARSGTPIGLPAGDPAGTITLTIEQAQPTFSPLGR